MAVGTIKRHDTEPSPRLVINAAAGGAYDLTNHSARMIMKAATTLSVEMTDIQLTCTLPGTVVDIVELGDTFVIDHERLTVGGVLPVQPLVGATAEFTVARAATRAATAGAVLSSANVAGTGGVNQYRLSVNALFSVSVDDGPVTVVTVLAALTAANNTMADLVSDVQTAIGVAAIAVTAGNQADKLSLTSNSTGATSNIAISAVDAIAEAELGLVAAYGRGEAADVTVAAGHSVATAVSIIKIDRLAIVDDPATSGVLTFEWVAGDTDKLGTFLMEFVVTTPQGKRFTAPNNDSFDVAIVADFDDV